MASAGKALSAVKAVRIYMEGGGDQRDKSQPLREGLGQFLAPLRERARLRKINWDIMVCGSRNSAFDNFKTALKVHPEAFNILLVDSEGPVHQQPWAHLKRDRWKKPARVKEENCHLMVQAMEAWLIADVDALRAFYGQGFNSNPIPKTKDVENVEKARLVSSLRQAIRKTSKRDYDKTRHAPKILALLNAERVQKKAAHCKRLFNTLTKIMK